MCKHSKRLIISVVVALSVSSCSTYPSKFKCGDARGLGCQMLATVDQQITTGQIQEVYMDKTCKGTNCRSSDKSLPQLATGEVIAVRLEGADNDEVITINNGQGHSKYLLIRE